MSIGLVGRKCGMSRIFTDEGISIPVTVVHIYPNRIVQKKKIDIDGYNSIQVTTGLKKISKINKSLSGHYLKSGVVPGVGLWEFKYLSDTDSYNLGDEISVDFFKIGQSVNITSFSKGKGFAGTIKRYNFKGQGNSHGNSRSHRAPGSIGQCQTPGRVFKGKKMAGHMGNKKVTIRNLDIVKIDNINNLLFIKGAVAGAKTRFLIVKNSLII